MAITGLNRQLARDTYNKANKKIDDLKTDLNNLKTAVQTMNRDYWYGGNSANKWYANVSSAHTSNNNFINAAVRLQSSIKSNLDDLDNKANRNNDF